MFRPVSALNDKLKGKPEHVIVLGLLAVAALAVVVALSPRVPPVGKAGVLAWFVAP